MLAGGAHAPTGMPPPQLGSWAFVGSDDAQFGVPASTMRMSLTPFFCAVAMYLHWSPFASMRLYEGLLRFSLPAGSWSREKIREILGRYCASAILVAMREAVQGEAIEYSYQVKLLDPSFHADLLDALRAVEDLKDVNLLMHRATVEI